jgi:hypothetical protein
MKLIEIAVVFGLLTFVSCKDLVSVIKFVLSNPNLRVSVFQYGRFTRVACNSTGITCKNVLCNIKLASRYESFVNFSCDLQKTLKTGSVICLNLIVSVVLKTFLIQLSVGVVHKTVGGNYHKVINVKNFDVCMVLGNIDKFPIFKGVVNWFKVALPKLVHKCPYTVSFGSLQLFKLK